MTGYDERVHLQELLDLLAPEDAGIDPNALEREYLQFSRFSQKPTLMVRPHMFYSVRGEEAAHLREAYRSLGYAGQAPDAVDISGGDRELPQDHVVFLSPLQFRADPASAARASMQPLLEQVFLGGAELLQKFSLSEALAGRIKATRGTLDLRVTHRYPDRFTAGPYELRLTLDTPAQTIKQFQTFAEGIASMLDEPEARLLDRQGYTRLVEQGIALRERLGALSRYWVPGTPLPQNSFTATAHSVLVEQPESALYYLYTDPNGDRCRNILVHFGKDPFEQTKPPTELLCYRGEDHHRTLERLVQHGLFAPSPAILQERIAQMERLWQGAADGLDRDIRGEYPEFERLHRDLKAAAQRMRGDKPDAAEMLAHVPPYTLELMVCPAKSDPLLHELLSRLSWNPALRAYHDTRGFSRAFSAADDAGRERMLGAVRSSLLFSSQQNHDVNLWLYQHHAQQCEASGLSFDVPQ